MNMSVLAIDAAITSSLLVCIAFHNCEGHVSLEKCALRDKWVKTVECMSALRPSMARPRLTCSPHHPQYQATSPTQKIPGRRCSSKTYW
jgi:hypothetical protein